MSKQELKAIKLLSSEHPVTGVDIERLVNVYNLDGLDLNYVFGLSQASYQRNIRDSKDEPVASATLAILARYYEQLPGALERIMVPDITPSEVFGKISAHSSEKLTSRQFGISLGRNASYSTRVINSGQEISRSSAMSRLLLAIAYDIEQNGATMAVERLRSIAQTEARARHVVDLESHGSWNTDR